MSKKLILFQKVLKVKNVIFYYWYLEDKFEFQSSDYNKILIEHVKGIHSR